MNCAIAFPDCHLNPFIEKRTKNRGFRLFSPRSNKRGLIWWTTRIEVVEESESLTFLKTVFLVGDFQKIK